MSAEAYAREGDSWDLDGIALLGVSLAFIFGVAKWQEVEEDVDWGIFIMYCSAIALSGVLSNTGAAAGVSQYLYSVGNYLTHRDFWRYCLHCPIHDRVYE